MERRSRKPQEQHGIASGALPSDLLSGSEVPSGGLNLIGPPAALEHEPQVVLRFDVALAADLSG